MLSWDQQAAIFEAAITQNQLQLLSQQLGVPEKALRKVRVGWNGARGAYTIPEYDGFGQVCGISLRLESGKKGFIAGGNRGLILPRDWYEKCEEMMFVPEGASDVAELVGMELTALGRPSCGGKRAAAL